MKVVDECCMTWDARLAVRVGEHDSVTVQRQNDRLIIRTMDGEGLLDAEVDQHGCHSVRHLGKGCRVNFAPYLPRSQIALRNDLPLLQLRLLGTERDSAVDPGALDHSASSYPTFNPDPYLRAAAIIGDAWPEEYADFRETLHVVVPRTSPRRWRARGMTVSSYAGAIWLFVDTVVDLAEHMVHEQSHVKLRYIEDTCPILGPDQTAERFLVGWRKDPRPIVGIYEGVYVHLHVLTALSACNEQHLFSGEDAEACEARCRSVLIEVEEGLNLLSAHGLFTDAGNAYLEWAAETLDDLRARAA
jgi:HEXXH motif-containing protein